MARAQFRGRKKVLIQALLTAAALNLKELVKRRPEAQSGWAAAVNRLYEPISSPISALSADLQAAPRPTLSPTRT